MTRLAALALAASLALLALPAAAQQPQPQRDTNIDLNASEKHVAETAYRGTRGVVIGGPDAGGWQLNAGASIEARSIDLTLRNVRGSVVLRADPSRLEPLVRRRRAAALGALQ